VRHGAGPSVEPTDVTVSASVVGGELTVRVRDNGAGATAEQMAASAGTGLRRLRERLAVLYDGQARLDVSTSPGEGLEATLVIPQAER
jgi:signal transduction histidine kinase